MAILLKRVYDESTPDDGYRVMIDRLWPRGLAKERARLDDWLKALAPSTELRKWFRSGDRETAWPEFQKRYRQELSSADVSAEIAGITARAKDGNVTLLTSVKDPETSYLSVLRDVIESGPPRSLSGAFGSADCCEWPSVTL